MVGNSLDAQWSDCKKKFIYVLFVTSYPQIFIFTFLDNKKNKKVRAVFHTSRHQTTLNTEGKMKHQLIKIKSMNTAESNSQQIMEYASDILIIYKDLIDKNMKLKV